MRRGVNEVQGDQRRAVKEEEVKPLNVVVGINFGIIGLDTGSVSLQTIAMGGA